MYQYLHMTAGHRAGTSFPLDAGKQNRIGRGLDCAIILTDPLSSRVHAIVLYEDDAWWVRDAGSRNGTLVNNQNFPAHWDPKLRIPRGQVVAAASIVSPKY